MYCVSSKYGFTVQYYDGTRSLIYPRLFDALKRELPCTANPSGFHADIRICATAGSDHDVMKGALYVLGAKAPQNMAILDWRWGPQYLLALLGCSHQDRPSVQNLVKTVTHDYIIRLAEPMTLKNQVDSESLNRGADRLESLISIEPDQDLVARVAAKARSRVDQKNEAYDQLVRRAQ